MRVGDLQLQGPRLLAFSAAAITKLKRPGAKVSPGPWVRACVLCVLNGTGCCCRLVTTCSPKQDKTGNVRLSAVLPGQPRQYWQLELYKQNELLQTYRMVSTTVRGHRENSGL